MKKQSTHPIITVEELKSLINTYHSNRTPIHRYASFDYCYNYFQSFRINNTVDQIASKENIEMSVLQLAFYLASWGMYRGSTAILRHSSHALKPVIEFVASTESKYWDIDVDNYPTKLNELVYLYNEIGASINTPMIKEGSGKPQAPTAILMTKIMLGIYGCTPAMDDFFMCGIGRSNFAGSGYSRSLSEVKSIWQEMALFYTQHQQIIDNTIIPSLAFGEGGRSYKYPKAKLLDMIFFEKGHEIKKAEKMKNK